MKMGDFLNQFAANPLIFWPLVVSIPLALVIFGYWYNGVVARDRHARRSLYVIIGVLVTLGAAALFSWKAALITLILFACSGLFMAIGDYQRRHEAQAAEACPVVTHAKRGSYKINGLADDAASAAEETSRHLTQAIKRRGTETELLSALSLAQGELTTIRLRINEIRQINKLGE
jgi:hypothetical protein